MGSTILEEGSAPLVATVAVAPWTTQNISNSPVRIDAKSNFVAHKSPLAIRRTSCQSQVVYTDAATSRLA
jgi:hypothetical protein